MNKLPLVQYTKTKKVNSCPCFFSFLRRRFQQALELLLVVRRDRELIVDPQFRINSYLSEVTPLAVDELAFKEPIMRWRLLDTHNHVREVFRKTEVRNSNVL